MLVPFHKVLESPYKNTDSLIKLYKIYVKRT